MSQLTSIHLRGQMRTLPADNFSMIGAQYDLVPVELWKQLNPGLKWRVEKPGRVAVMDGQSTLLYIKPANLAMKVPQAAPSAFDTKWLHNIADLSGTLTNQLNQALAKGWKLDLAEQKGADGKAKAEVTIHAVAGVPEGDIFKNKFLDLADTRQVYRFDVQSELLESVQAYLPTTNGDVLIFELSQIEFNQPIDPQVFAVQLPADVNWFQNEAQKLPNNEKYASMTAAQAAKAFLTACASEDWAEAGKFLPVAVDNRLKQLGRHRHLRRGRHGPGCPLRNQTQERRDEETRPRPQERPEDRPLVRRWRDLRDPTRPSVGRTIRFRPPV
jgi:hypothetical protein